MDPRTWRRIRPLLRNAHVPAQRDEQPGHDARGRDLETVSHEHHLRGHGTTNAPVYAGFRVPQNGGVVRNAGVCRAGKRLWGGDPLVDPGLADPRPFAIRRDHGVSRGLQRRQRGPPPGPRQQLRGSLTWERFKTGRTWWTPPTRPSRGWTGRTAL